MSVLTRSLRTEKLVEGGNCQFEALTPEIPKTASEMTDIPEPHDRLIRI
ncbi:Uncharacterized protein dnm_026170 [Desulfonema magnum]|uniref:Uncharacterized protein n=1 Tax=Desulfonema magnum TaxID=45655 RepID=A0A975GN76_9BACT|nr:Uncharacterized protein dnm_026170 [Desulfonema magnum]